MTTVKQAIDTLAANPGSVQSNASVLHYLSEILGDLVMRHAQSDAMQHLRKQGYAELLQALDAGVAEPSSYEETKGLIETRLEEMIALVRAGSPLSADLTPFYLKAELFAKDLQDQKVAFRQELSSRIARQCDYIPKVPSVEEFQTYLDHKYPRGDLYISRLEEVGNGFSKNVMLAKIRGLSEDTDEFIIRMDVAAGVTRTHVMDEYRLLRSIEGESVSAPELIFAEESEAAFGQPFYVMKRARGVPSGDFVMPGDDVRPEHGHDLARILAKLHAIPVSKLALPPPAREIATISDAVRQNVDDFYKSFQLDRFQAEPLITAGYLWLFDNIPSNPGRPVLVHGDPAFNNLLIAETSIAALVDWEYAHLGDPSEDLSYVKHAIESFMPWESFLDTYYKAGGHAFDETAGVFYTVWREMRNVTACITGQRSYVSGGNTHCKLPYSTTLLPRIYLDALDNIRRSVTSAA